MGTQTKRIQYRCDSRGRRSALIDHNGGRLTCFYDAVHRITQVLSPHEDRTTAHQTPDDQAPNHLMIELRATAAPSPFAFIRGPAFYTWSSRTLRGQLEPDARATLEQRTDCDVEETPLRDVVSYLGEIDDLRIEFDGAVDGEAEVSIHASGTLGDALNRLLTPLGLVAAPVGRRIVVGTPEVVQETVDTFDHQNQIGRAIVIGILALCVALAVWFVRRRVARRRSADARTSS